MLLFVRKNGGRRRVRLNPGTPFHADFNELLFVSIRWLTWRYPLILTVADHRLGLFAEWLADISYHEETGGFHHTGEIPVCDWKFQKHTLDQAASVHRPVLNSAKSPHASLNGPHWTPHSFFFWGCNTQAPTRPRWSMGFQARDAFSGGWVNVTGLRCIILRSKQSRHDANFWWKGPNNLQLNEIYGGTSRY